jgi:hypothetical protein
MQRMVVPLEDYNEVVGYAPQWAIDKWNLEQPRTIHLVWQPHWWPWGKSHGRWVSKIMSKRHGEAI